VGRFSLTNERSSQGSYQSPQYSNGAQYPGGGQYSGSGQGSGQIQGVGQGQYPYSSSLPMLKNESGRKSLSKWGERHTDAVMNDRTPDSDRKHSMSNMVNNNFSDRSDCTIPPLSTIVPQDRSLTDHSVGDHMTDRNGVDHAPFIPPISHLTKTTGSTPKLPQPPKIGNISPYGFMRPLGSILPAPNSHHFPGHHHNSHYDPVHITLPAIKNQPVTGSLNLPPPKIPSSRAGPAHDGNGSNRNVGKFSQRIDELDTDMVVVNPNLVAVHHIKTISSSPSQLPLDQKILSSTEETTNDRSVSDDKLKQNGILSESSTQGSDNKQSFAFIKEEIEKPRNRHDKDLWNNSSNLDKMELKSFLQDELKNTTVNKHKHIKAECKESTITDNIIEKKSIIAGNNKD